MQSFIEQSGARQPSPSLQWGEVLKRWNRKLHYYLGLYLLFFVWLFLVHRFSPETIRNGSSPSFLG